MAERMKTASLTPPERARKGLQLALHAMQDAGKAGEVAAAMGVSDSTISRIKTERLEEVVLFLAHLGLKVVPSAYKCVDPAAYDFLTATHQRLMQKVPELIWEQEE